jgi:outer membrane protein OmpA-like peptidoglycan-associated protein
MGERALTASLSDTDVVARRGGRAEGQSHSDSPAIRLLDALREGDDFGVLAVCGETTTASAENMRWTCRGREEIHEMLIAVRERFPGLTFESRTRHIGFGLVIDEARVQDVPPHDEVDAEPGDKPAASAPPAHLAEVSPEDVAAPGADVHPMWDEPVTEKRNVMEVWRHRAEDLPPMRLNMPVRVTVRHDDLQVHDITLSFPAALLKRALGMHVDPLEMSLSEVQSAFIAPVGAGFTTHEIARPELTLAPPAPPEPEPEVTQEEPPRRRRRRRVVVPLLLILLAVAAGAGWWEVQGKDAVNVAGEQPAASTSPTPQPQPSPSASTSPAPSASSSVEPKVTQAPASSAPSRKPNVTLKSDLAFGFNSAKLSSAAKREIDRVAKEVRDAGLSGNIYVDGYTDNLGSAAYGKVLSQQRATAVSNYLKTQLVGVPVTIVSIGHGEADPIKSNSTKAGRMANRRVTITLPKP